jgi:hypothetical protein
MIIIKENDFRSVGSIDCEGRYALRLELISDLIRDISDELYTITNKIENIGRIANSIGCKDAKELSADIVDSLNSILDKEQNYEWNKLLEEINDISTEE